MKAEADRAEAVDALEENMRQKLRYLPSKLPPMEVKMFGDISVVDSTLETDTVNTAFGGTITAESSKNVYDYFRSRNLPMAWWVCPSSFNDEADAILRSQGFTYDEKDVGMVCSLGDVIDRHEMPESLEIHQCESPDDFKDFSEVLSSVFNPPDEAVKILYDRCASIPADEREKMVLYVGYESGIPVSTACLFFTDVAGIYDISTKPEHRNKRYGSALFYHALAEAKRLGFQRAILQASPDGLNIYKRFGFEELCELHIWNLKPQ